MKLQEIISKFNSLANSKNTEGMARFGINVDKAFGISMPVVRKMAKDIGRDHGLAIQLWDSGYHEARILAGLVAEKEKVTPDLMEKWAADFDSWDVCDQVCMNLFDRTLFSYEKAIEWSGREEEFVKRAGFALMASLAMHDKKEDDARIAEFLPFIISGAVDERNFVKKAVNWALRQIGKRSMYLNALALKTAGEIEKIDSRSARWNAKDAIKELTSEKILDRIREKEKRKKK